MVVFGHGEDHQPPKFPWPFCHYDTLCPNDFSVCFQNSDVLGLERAGTRSWDSSYWVGTVFSMIHYPKRASQSQNLSGHRGQWEGKVKLQEITETWQLWGQWKEVWGKSMASEFAADFIPQLTRRPQVGHAASPALDSTCTKRGGS